MAFDFPASPAVNDEYTQGEIVYIWTGTSWDIKGGGDLQDYLPLAGGTMSGNIELADGVQLVGAGDVNLTGNIDNTGHLQSRGGIYSTGVQQITAREGSRFQFNNTDNNAWQTALQMNSGIYLQYHQGGNNDGRLRIFTSNGGYSDTWVMETTIVSGYPGIKVNGNIEARQLVNRDGTHIRCAEVDGYGIQFYGGAHIYKRSGYGVVLRKHTQNTQFKIEQNDGSGLVDIATASFTTFSDIGIALPELENDAELMPFAREDNEHKGFDVAKVLTLLLTKIRSLEDEVATLRGGPAPTVGTVNVVNPRPRGRR